MKKTFTVVSIDEKDRNSARRRMVVVELQCETSTDRLGEDAPAEPYTTVMVQYPAYGEEHYTHNLSKYPNGGIVNHTDAQAISDEIKKMIGKD